MNNNKNIRLMTYIPLCAVINIIGGFIAVQLKLVIYIDTIGTILSSFLFGPLAGITVGIITPIVSGMLFDPVSIYFMPVQITIAFIAGMLYKEDMFQGKKIVVSILILSISNSIIASIIASVVFNGMTSSGVSYIIAILKNCGIGVFESVFSTQIISDLIDKTMAVLLSIAIIKALPRSLKQDNTLKVRGTDING